MGRAKRQLRIQELTTILREQIQDAIEEFNDGVDGQLCNIEILYALRSDPNEQGKRRPEVAMIDITFAVDE